LAITPPLLKITKLTHIAIGLIDRTLRNIVAEGISLISVFYVLLKFS